MTIFNRYVELPEGAWYYLMILLLLKCVHHLILGCLNLNNPKCRKNWARSPVMIRLWKAWDCGPRHLVGWWGYPCVVIIPKIVRGKIPELFIHQGRIVQQCWPNSNVRFSLFCNINMRTRFYRHMCMTTCTHYINQFFTLAFMPAYFLSIWASFCYSTICFHIFHDVDIGIS